MRSVKAHLVIIYLYVHFVPHVTRVHDDGPNGAVPLKTSGAVESQWCQEKQTKKTLRRHLKMAEVSKSVSSRWCDMMFHIKGAVTIKTSIKRINVMDGCHVC